MKDIIRQGQWGLIASALLATAGTAAGFVPFVAVYWIAESAVGGALTRDILQENALIALAGVLAKVLLTIGASAFSHRAAYQILYKIRVALIARLNQVPLGFFAGQSLASLKKTINEDVEQVEEALAHAVPDVVSAVSVPVVVAGFLLFIDWRLALAALVMYPILVMIYPLSFKMAKNEMGDYFAGLLGLRAAAIEFFQGMKVIRTYLGGERAFEKLEKAIDFMADATWRMSTAAAVPAAFMMVGLRANVLVLLPVGSFLYLSGEVSANAVVLFLLLGMGVNASVYKLLYTAGSFSMRMKQAGANIQSVLTAQPLPEPDQPRIPDRFDITFKGVSFSYEGNGGIQNISFAAPSNGVTAIVGPSGGGKTTIARLIGRFWDVEQGAIEIGGVDLREMNSRDLVGNVSFILQDAWLQNDTIRENIRAGRPDASDDEVTDAAARACVLEFAEHLVDGLDSPVGEGGKLLSGGQRQRVAIARAILRAAPIVVMDEGTSALDPDNEEQVLTALSELAKGRTVIAIAHRLNTIRNADNILYLEEGALVAQGRHDELKDKCPAYATLCDKYEAAGGWVLENDEVATDLLDAARLRRPAASVNNDTAVADGALPLYKSAIRQALALTGKHKKTLLGKAVPLLILEAMTMGAPVVATLLVLLDINAGTLTQEKVLYYSGMVVAFFAIQIIANIVSSRVLWRVQTGVVASLQERLARHLRRVPLGVLGERDTGMLEALMTQHTTELNYVTPTTQLVRSIIAPCISMTFMFLLDWRLALAVLSTIPVFLLVLSWSDRISRKTTSEMFASREVLNGRIIEFLQGIQTLRSLGIRDGEGVGDGAFNQVLARHRDISLATVTRVAPAVAAGLSILDLGFCAIMVVGGLLTISGSLTLPIYLVFLVIGLVFYGPIGDVIELVFYRRQQERSIARISDLLTLPILPEPAQPQRPASPHVAFENVSFSYGETVALEGASLNVKAGSLCAFVGPSGSGKSTALNLLARFWDVDTGAIKIGDVDLRSLAAEDRADLFAIVFQDTFLFNDTIAANLCMGRADITEEEMVAASKAAKCHDFVMALEDGYESVVGDGGANLSGGQRQRLAIARAILKDAPIVLLDEATASIDPENEYDIRLALASLCRGRTVIVVAHRLSSVTEADQIVVFDQGAIVGSGRHEALLEDCATYKRLWTAQTGQTSTLAVRRDQVAV